MMNDKEGQWRGAHQQALNGLIFGYDTKAGRLFDVALIIMIAASVLAVMLESVQDIDQVWRHELYIIEWGFTLLFTLEYGLRVYSARSARHYIFSFYGVVDLLSILPTYLSFLLPGASTLVVIRILRILRIFRVLKLTRYMGEANILLYALLGARRKIFVFLYGVLTLVVIFGAMMYLIEGPDNGFTSIPKSMYWAIVTVTTLGYGDISPLTALGQTVASIAVITGYSIIAIPFGIFSAELMNEFQRRQKSDKDPLIICSACKLEGHERDASYCRRCGKQLS